MSQRNSMARVKSPGGVIDLTPAWPPNMNNLDADGNPSRGPIGNQRFYVATEMLPQTYRAFVGGIGSGKTIAGAELYLEAAMESPASTGIICARDLPQCKKSQIAALEQVAWEWAEKNGVHPIQSHNRSDHFFQLINGHKAYYTGVKYPDAIRGITAALIWWDEPNSAEDPNYAFRVLRGRLRQTGTNIARLLFLLTGTPDGLQGPMMYWRDRCKHEVLPGIFIGSGQFSEWLMVKMRTGDNSANPRDYESDARADYDKRFAAQELDAGFDPRFHELHVAIDWGLRYPHVLWFARDRAAAEDQRIPSDVIIDEFCEDDATVDQVLQVLADRQETWGRPYDCFYPDPAGKQENHILRKKFPGVDVRRFRKTEHRAIRWGVFVMRGRLLNGAGHRRLLIAERVAKMPANRHPEGRGICNGLRFYDFARTRQGMIKQGEFRDDSWYVHGVDCARYYLTQMYSDDRGPMPRMI